MAERRRPGRPPKVEQAKPRVNKYRVLKEVLFNGEIKNFPDIVETSEELPAGVYEKMEG